MVSDFSHWTRVLKNLLFVFLMVLGIYLAIKLSIYYMPFLIAFILSLIIEPVVKYIMKKTNFTRKTSALIIFVIVLTLIIGCIIWLGITLFSEASNLLQGLNEYIDKIYSRIQYIQTSIKIDNIKLPEEFISVLNTSLSDALANISNWIRRILTNLINTITLIPSMAICAGITILALYFICVDKVYILDQIEYHTPQNWVKEIKSHLKEIILVLGGYLKAEVLLVIISFIISLIGFYIIQIIGIKVEYPLLMALFIGFIDALPILGSGTVMVPWAIISAVNRKFEIRNSCNYFIYYYVNN